MKQKSRIVGGFLYLVAVIGAFAIILGIYLKSMAPPDTGPDTGSARATVKEVIASGSGQPDNNIITVDYVVTRDFVVPVGCLDQTLEYTIEEVGRGSAVVEFVAYDLDGEEVEKTVAAKSGSAIWYLPWDRTYGIITTAIDGKWSFRLVCD